MKAQMISYMTSMGLYMTWLLCSIRCKRFVQQDSELLGNLYINGICNCLGKMSVPLEGSPVFLVMLASLIGMCRGLKRVYKDTLNTI